MSQICLCFRVPLGPELPILSPSTPSFSCQMAFHRMRIEKWVLPTTTAMDGSVRLCKKHFPTKLLNDQMTRVYPCSLVLPTRNEWFPITHTRGILDRLLLVGASIIHKDKQRWFIHLAIKPYTSHGVLSA